MSTLQITLLLLMGIFLFKLFVLPVLRKKYPKTFKTPVTITSYDQVVGKDQYGKDMTYKDYIATEDVQKGMDYMDAGDYRSAVTSLLSAQKAGFNDVHFLLAECYNEMGYYVEAVGEMDKAIAAKPDDSEFYHMRAAIKINTGKFDGVDTDRQKAFELIKIDNEKNRERNENAVKEGYSSLTAKYENIFSEIDEQMKIITEKGPPAPNPGSVAMNNK